ncbi:hypothetical protein QE152_g1625 [Popillia japonica]|uniref:Uncharacterized protein n=1 Tax=Popillia japonica TaxID=7064 RepID=A0AAW1N9L0_POPJA
MQNTLNKYPSVVFTSADASISVCHFFTIDLSLSVVKSIPWKLVSTLRPCTSSAINLNLRKERSASESLCKSANETSKTLYFKPSEAIFVPWVRFTRVFPICLVVNMHGAFTSYQSLRVKGSEHAWCLHIVPIFTSEGINAEIASKLG